MQIEFRKILVIFVIPIIVISGIVYLLSSKNNEEVFDVIEYLEKGEEYLEERYYSKALEQFKLAINGDPSNVEAYLKASEIYKIKGKNDKALEILFVFLSMLPQQKRVVKLFWDIPARTSDLFLHS